MCMFLNSIIGIELITFILCIQGVQKNPQTIENDLLLEFQWPSTKMNVKSAHS